ncbi:hypothetical protein LZZ85_07090 [Terrimonas sp. NA20]|uniref:Transglutaminase-like domain-containing protein n=1 Tax=Terrimonas ginsenosidimutans TaxID=2908004 RepID=A0ABS9KP17_9BACT|nr:transglutaminase domain-containing protein [Terrimonas ginsenosidimutans]MCG2614039.1 hypothetical protein [Terrimonas ginsenosidimutans]
MRTSLPLLILLIFHGHAMAQPSPGFASVDSFAITVKYDNDIYNLTKELTAPYKGDVQKARSVFRWLTHNIRYDYKLFNKGGVKGPVCKTGENCEEVYRNWERNYFHNVLKKKKAVCDGYARVYKRMCEIAGLRCEIIGGYTKSKPYQVGIMGIADHAWNAVWVDSAYILLDATWAAGYCSEDESTGKLTGFTRQFNEYYWMTSFPDLSRNHFPKDPKWIFANNYTEEKYANNPYYASSLLGRLQLLSPASGVIEAKKGDTIHFRFEYTGTPMLLQLNTNIFRNHDVLKTKKLSRKRSVSEVDTLA